MLWYIRTLHRLALIQEELGGTFEIDGENLLPEK